VSTAGVIDARFKDPSESTYFSLMFDDIEKLITILTTNGADRTIAEDIYRVQQMMFITGISTNLTTWEQIPGMIIDPHRYDRYLNRQALVGFDSTGQMQGYPSRKSNGEQLEIRGLGTPTPGLFMGLDQAMWVDAAGDVGKEGFYQTFASSDPARIGGLVTPGVTYLKLVNLYPATKDAYVALSPGEASDLAALDDANAIGLSLIDAANIADDATGTAFYLKHRYRTDAAVGRGLLIASPEHGWGNTEHTQCSVLQSANASRLPWRHAQWLKALSGAQNVEIELYESDPVDYEFYMKGEHVGLHLLGYLSGATGIPPVR
jgi:hypothetical protein